MSTKDSEGRDGDFEVVKVVTFNLWLALGIVVIIALAIGAIAAGFGFWMGWMFGG